MIRCEVCHEEPGDDTLHEFRCFVLPEILLLCGDCFDYAKLRCKALAEVR